MAQRDLRGKEENMNTQFEKPDFIADEHGRVRDVRSAKSMQEPVSQVSWMTDAARSQGGKSNSGGSRPPQRSGRQIALIPIPIGLIVSLCAFLISSVANCGNQRTVDLFDEGNAFHEGGNFEQAIAKYTLAIERKPDFWEAYYNRGLANQDSGDYNLAIADFGRALQLNSGFARGYFSRGLAYYALEETDKAIDDFDQAIEQTPEFIADRWADAADEPEARPLATMPGYLENSPFAIDLPKVYAYRGLAYLAQGEVDKALADLDKAIEFQPTLALAFYARGVARFAMGDYDLALADLDAVLELDNDPEVHQAAESLLNELGVGPEIEMPWSEQS
jgi:tetratricopeptide (TPR) repeat protein